MYAAKRGDDELAAELLSHGASVNSRAQDGLGALYLAAAFGTHGLVSRLLKAGADPNFKTHPGQTPLIVATFVGHPDSAVELIKHGADPAIKDNSGRTALLWAAIFYRDIHDINDGVKHPKQWSTSVDTHIEDRSLEEYLAGHRLSDKQILMKLEKDYKDIVIQLAPLCENMKQVDNSGESADAIISQIVRKGQK
jgi:hypothetical protein